MKKIILFSILLAASTGVIAHANQAAQDSINTVSQQSEAEQPIASGTWIKKKSSSKGLWKISKKDGITTISLDEDFKTKKAPDLKLYLSPLTADEVGSDSAVSGSVLISPLDSHKGPQSYVIPEQVDVSQYKSILIHCEAYTKLWSAADL